VRLVVKALGGGDCGKFDGVHLGVCIVVLTVDTNGCDSPAGALSDSNCSSLCDISSILERLDSTSES